jgi:uncharacterized protein (TIGR03083 family)
VDIGELLDQLQHHGDALATKAARAGTQAQVPTCPDWTVRDLLAHTGMVHRWAAENVRDGRAAFDHNTREPDFPAPEDGVIDWFREGHAGLVRALRDAPDDLDAMTFLAGAGSARHFWARRQAHETAVHHADAAAALDEVPAVEPAFALDGIGELLEGFYGRRGGKLLADPPATVRIAPDGADTSWLIELRPDDRVITRDKTGPADCTVRGAAGDLYLFLWNRRPAGSIKVDGDERALSVWHERAKIRWR